MQGTNLGPFDLDLPRAWELGRNNTGIFVGGFPAFDKAIDRLRSLRHGESGHCLILVAESKRLAAELIQFCFADDPLQRISEAKMQLPRRFDSLILCTPETLKRIDPSQVREAAAIILLDPACHVHKARCMSDDGYGMSNDRPQHVANFRCSLLREGWAPPLVLLTRSPAQSLPTDHIAQAYCLDAWWFLDGGSIRFGYKPREMT